MAPKNTLINVYITKMEDPDMDFRFMALSDLTNTAAEDPALFGTDENLESRTVTKVIQLVQDKNSEVKNQAVKCLGQLVKIIKEAQMNSVIDNLVEFIGAKDDELRAVAGLALKSVTAEIPDDGKLTARACSVLAPKLLAQIHVPAAAHESVNEMLSILSTLLSRFPVYMADIHPSPVTTIVPLLSHDRLTVRKRAITVLAQSLPMASPATFESLQSSVIQPGLNAKAPLEQHRTVMLLISSMARYAPNRVAPALETIVPSIIDLSASEDEELQDACLQALETLVLRCHSEMTQFIISAINVATVLIRHDPNYTEDLEDEEMADADDEDDDDEDLGDDYSDDEDTSYKVRRSANKLLTAIIGTRPDFLVTIYRSVAPVLVMRFSEREDSVRLDIWAAYTTLLQQTKLYGSAPQSKESEGVAGTKRKREKEGMDLEETTLSLLRSQIPGMTKVLIRHLQGKASQPLLQAGFVMLNALLLVAPGSLTTQVPTLAPIISDILKKSTSTSSSLHTTVVSFLELVFGTHSPPSFSSSLGQLTGPLLSTVSEKDPRVAAAGFRAFSTLLQTLKPLRTGDWIDDLFERALVRLETGDTDVAVREQAELCISTIWLCATEVARSKNDRDWVALRKSGRTSGAIKVVTIVAKEVDFPTEWIQESVTWTLGVIRKSSRNQKDDALVCLNTLIGKYHSDIPTKVITDTISQLLPYLVLTELSHFTNALSVITSILRQAPQNSYPIIEKDVLPAIYECGVSSLPNLPLLDNVVNFFTSLVSADPSIATRLIPGLISTLEKTSGGGIGSALNTGRCIGAVVRAEISLAAAAISDHAKSIKAGSKASDPRVVLSLHVLGEIGRFVDMTLQSDVFTNAVALFTSESQEVRAAAAFAAGNIAIGNLRAFLPVIVKQVTTSDHNRILSLHALKEVVTYTSSSDLESVADSLWPPLFENPENAEESTRNVAAACLGRLTNTNPARYLPLLQAKLKDSSATVRATSVASVRYTFADTTESYDELLSPLILEFLSLVVDPDLTVRRLSLTALNAAARNKPSLIQDQLAALMPMLYGETKQKAELIRVVDMGPWKHRVDDGLETRKTAFETMYTILDTCLSKFDLHLFFTHVLQGLSDESDEIKVLCHMMLFRLSQVAPATVAQRLDEVSPELEEAVKGAKVTKDTVKQDLERAGELQRSALRAIAALSKIGSPTVSPRMYRLVESLEKGPLARDFRELQ